MNGIQKLEELGVSLDELITAVRDLHPEGDDVARLADATSMSERLGEIGEHLVAYFVDQARTSGASWSTIGASLGVTKQAAQKHFAPNGGQAARDGIFSRFTEYAWRSIDTAREEARRLKNPEVGSQHLLLGLMSEREGLAAETLEALGCSARAVREMVVASQREESESLPPRIPYSPQAQDVFKVALREALRRGQNYIGTEHLLLGILADDDSAAARILLELGVTRAHAAERLTNALAAVTTRKAELPKS
jgi:hypothetical protein